MDTHTHAPHAKTDTMGRHAHWSEGAPGWEGVSARSPSEMCMPLDDFVICMEAGPTPRLRDEASRRMSPAWLKFPCPPLDDGTFGPTLRNAAGGDLNN